MKRKVNLILVRHGETKDNVNDILIGHGDSPFTELGKKQNKAVARQLKKEKIDALYFSPLGRTEKTAEIIANELDGLNTEIESLLIERDFGILTGKRKDEMLSYTSKIYKTNMVDFLEAKGVESFPQLLKRAQKIIKKMEKKHPQQTVLLVTHGDIGKMIRAAYYGWNWQKGMKAAYFGHDDILKLVPKNE